MTALLLRARIATPRAYLTSSTMASASTGIPSGSPEHPTADLLAFPAGPNTSMSRFAKPLTTAGCLVKSPVQFLSLIHI